MKRKLIAILISLAFAPAAFAGNCSDGDSIVDLAVATPELSTLVAAVVKADLVDVLDGNRNFTVFAPTNDAFDATAETVLGAGNTGIDLVNALPVDMLTNVLTYHVAPGKRLSDAVLTSSQIRMLSKDFTTPSVQSGAPFINDSEIALPDLEACNGVVHVIGTGVLLPPSM